MYAMATKKVVHLPTSRFRPRPTLRPEQRVCVCVFELVLFSDLEVVLVSDFGIRSLERS